MNMFPEILPLPTEKSEISDFAVGLHLLTEDASVLILPEIRGVRVIHWQGQFIR
jgi:hypothetical protein